MNNIMTGHGENITAQTFRENFGNGTVFSCGHVAKTAGYTSTPVAESEYAGLCGAGKVSNVSRDNSASR